MDYQYGEIQIDTTANIQLVGDKLQPTKIHCSKQCRVSQPVPNTVEGTFDGENYLQTPDNAVTGTSELVRTSQPIGPPIPIQNQTTLEPPQTSKARYRTSGKQPNEVPNGKMVVPDEEPSTSRSSGDNMHYTLRCFQDRLGLHNQPGKIPRNIRQVHEGLQYQCSRTPNHMVGHPGLAGDGPHITHSDGQQCSRLRNKENLVQRQHTGQHSRADLEESTYNELDHQYSPYWGKVQYLGRSVVKKHNHLNRMGYTPRNFPKGDTETGATSTGGPVRNKFKSQVSNICVSLPRPVGDSSRCSVDRLEQMGLYLPVSPQPLDFEGFAETDTVQCQDSNLLDP